MAETKDRRKMAPGQKKAARRRRKMAPGQQETARGGRKMAPGQQEAARGRRKMAPGQQEAAREDKNAAREDKSAFKHWIGPALLDRLGAELRRARPGLRTQPLTALHADLEPLELKDRVRLVRETLRKMLPQDYERALAVLLDASRGPSLKGFDLWPITEFVQTYGLDSFDASMDALHELTQRFTAEFTLRPFLTRHPARTLAVLQRWTMDPSHHVRRAASEGSRPRLPWGERVAVLIEDPGPGLNLLEALKFDPEIYVRRSVANHLNDVSKDHPDRVIETLRRWRRECPAEHVRHLEWIVRHALRGLIKRGHPGALALIGAAPARVRASALVLGRPRVRVGDHLEFAFTLVSTSGSAQKLVVDYVISFLTARGALSPKVFKLKTFELPAGGRIALSKRHAMRPITTRVYYPGAHHLAIQVNGAAVLQRRWHLTRA
ncbi:MAG: DNA alkylation repair protein [Vicinamibacterales bacterium]